MNVSTPETSGLSHGQRALWYLNQLEPQSTAYHLAICLELSGPLDESALASAWADVVRVHPQLRARFFLRGDEEPSIANDPRPSRLVVENGGLEKLDLFWKQIARTPFALEQEAPVRAFLLRGSNGVSHLLLCSHHIVTDLWSSAIILRELSANYQAQLSRQNLPGVPIENLAGVQFAAAERHWLAAPEGLDAWSFWRKHFTGINLSPGLTRQIADEPGGEVPITIKPPEEKLIRNVARAKATTPYAVLLACYARLLGEETNRDELFIGTPATIRHCAALRNAVGYFVNAVPVRCPVDAVTVVAANAHDALRQRRFPFSVLVQRLGVPRTPGTTPIFQTMFAYQSLQRSHRDLLRLALRNDGTQWEFGGGLTARTVARPVFDAQFPVALTLGPVDGGFSGSLSYDGQRVTAATAARLAGRFPALIRGYLKTRKLRPREATPGAGGKRLENVFDETALRLPDAIAVSEGGVSLSYAQVKAKADAMAASLNAVLPDCDRPVAMQMSSCADASILLLALLKSGRTFQPVDPGEPEARRNAALLQTDACALISAPGIDPGALPAGVIALDLEQLNSSSSAVSRLSAPSPAAYLVYTSGSTGQPKAVDVGHAAVINHAHAMARIFGLTSHDRVLQFHTLAFDAAFEEMFPTWLTGGCVVFEPRSRTLNIPAFVQMVRQDHVTVLNLPTSYWHTLTMEASQSHLEFPANVRLLVVGGEQALPKTYHVWRALAPACRWINTYGPTETTITALAYEPPAGRPRRGAIPIGRPVDGVTTLLLNKASRPASVGTGELLVGGKGLARGYRGDPRSTAAKFVTRKINGRAQRFYRTGDRVKLRPDGNFEYLGRLDRQLKIRGYRVDPDEIERVLRSHPRVHEAVVMPQAVREEVSLTGWITPADLALTEPELRAHLSRRLPLHMIPTQLNFVTCLPRKPGGKIDRAALTRIHPQRVPHPGDGSSEMVALFSELLGHKVGPRDDFFLAGGHSLLAIRLLGRIEARFGARISLSDFLLAPTPKTVWQRIRPVPVSKITIPPEIIPGQTPVSAQQSRALLPHEIGHPSLANMVLPLHINGRLDERALATAIEIVARQNVLLRTSFIRTDGGIVTRDSTELPKLERRTLYARDFKNAALNLARQEGARPFPLDGRTPWIRLLFVCPPRAKTGCLILITHHAVADGWTLELLLEDLRAAYDHAGKGVSGSLKPVRDYRLHALEQARWLKSPPARAQMSFWQKRLAQAGEVRLPFRRPATPDMSWQIKRHAITLSPRLSRDLRRVAASYGTTPFALMMACFKALVHRYAGQSDILLGSVVSNRSTRAEQGIFGPLQNPVLIRDEVVSGLSLRQLARRVSHSLVEAQTNGALPFGQVVRTAGSQHLATREDRIQFLSHDHSRRALRLGAASITPVDLPAESSPFELSIGVSAAASRVKIVFEYQPAAYAAAGIRCLAQQYAALLHSAAETPDATVAGLNLIPAAELRRFHRRIAKVHLPSAGLLHDSFELQARQHPGTTAIIAPGRNLTYGELDSLADATAQMLVESGLKKNGLVAVMLPKGWEQVVGCLAILKAGGTYVPLDPAHPKARLQAVFEQGKFHAAIAAGSTSDAGSLAGRWCPVITIHARPLDAFKPCPTRARPDSLAYIIFTSGSTGAPKGVMISHQAAMTTIAEIHRRFQIRPADRVLAVSALGFDLSVFDIFGTLRAGGTIVMPASQDPKEWLGLATTHRVTIWNSVPCLFELLLDETAGCHASLATLRLIMLSGDFISPALARRTRAALPSARFVSLGGATEAAIWSIAHEIKDLDPAWHRVPYGRALRHQEMFVLDDALNPCPAGVSGELFIAGAGLAAGYWRNRPETKRRFLTHPRHGTRLYRTGDKGSRLPDGDIEILGRLDEQVKANGVRIEPGEIETALCSLSSVRQAVVGVHHDPAGNKKLVACVVAGPGTNEAALLAHARKLLPTTLIPSRFMFLDRFPLTANGKVDRTILHAFSPPTVARPVILPEDPAEQWIANLWSDLLGGISVGMEDDFFALGGHSLLAIKMLQRVRSHFTVDLPLALIVEHPHVRGLAAAVKAAAGSPNTGLTRRSTAGLELDSEPVIATPVRRTNHKPGAVLLTGATGHLGSALLLKLLEKTSGQIFCLVRSASESEAEMRLRKVFAAGQIKPAAWRRVVVVQGDLSRERLGLSPAAFAGLAISVRAIYHCAAEVNFMAPYEKLAPGNVGGTREMIRLATTGGSVLHHVSSVAVFPYGSTGTVREDDDITSVRTLTGGYAQTKWVAERMVGKAGARGLRAVIYRPGQILGRAGNSPHDLFEHVLQACRKLGAVPDLAAKLDMITPDYAANAICTLSNQTSSTGKVFHLVHPKPVSLRSFIRLLPSPLPLLPVDSWLTLLNQAARQSDDVSLHFVSILAQGLNRAEMTPPGFDCSRTTNALRGTGIVCPPLDRRFVQRLLLPDP